MTTFEQLCQSRRSIRKYSDEPVTRQQLDTMLRCALMAPAGKRLNPWQFYILTREEDVRALAGCREMGSGMFKTAKAAIVVAVDTSVTDTWMCDGAIAAHNLLLSASDLGLGACWCHIYGREGAEQKVREIAHVSDHLTILCVVSVGHKDEDRKQYDLEKLPYDKVHYQD